MKVGLIGAGLQGRRRAEALLRSGTQLVIVASDPIHGARELAASAGCEATDTWEEVVLRDDVEAILVCTPPHLHEVMCVRAFETGKHVLCEKPLARTPEEAQRILDAARGNGRKLKCGFNLRHHPGIRQAREWVGQGTIGELCFIRCRYGIGGQPGYDKDWRATPEISGGGQLMDQGMHTLDLARWFLGDFVEASGFLQTCFWDIAPLEDNAFCLLRTDKGQVASIHVSWTQWKNLFSIEIFGKDGYSIVKGLGGAYGVEKAVLGRRAFLKPFAEETVEFRGEDRSWDEEWQEFRCAIQEDREPLASGFDGWAAVVLAHAIYESANKGHTVQPLPSDEEPG